MDNLLNEYVIVKSNLFLCNAQLVTYFFLRFVVGWR